MSDRGSMREAHETWADNHADDAQGTLWAAFADSASPVEMLGAWLALQCSEIPGAKVAVLLLRRPDGTFGPAAVWPDRMTDVTSLGAAAELALTERRGVTRPVRPSSEDGGSARAHHHIAYPIESDGGIHGVIVIDTGTPSGTELRDIMRRLHWGAGWIEGLVWRQRHGAAEARLADAATALEMLALVQEHDSVDGAAIALVNELAKKLRCGRVSLGLQTKSGVRLRALSHSAWFKESSDLVAAIENAMEECYDQVSAIAAPPIPGTEHRTAIAHRELLQKWGASSAASVVLKTRGEPVGVLTFERNEGEPLDAAAIALAELVGSLTGPLVKMKADQRRWFAGRFADMARRTGVVLFGPRHPAAKAAAAAALILLAFLAVAPTEFRVTGKSVLEGSVQLAAVAPFQGFIKSAPVKAGDIVAEGQVLATLDDRDLRLEKIKWESEQQKLLQKQRDALAKHERANILIATAQLRQAEAELALAAEKLARTRILAPIEGILVSGDLSQSIGSPVEQGKVLFEVAPLDAYRIVIHVSEFDIRHVKTGQAGTLSLTGAAGETLPIQVERITSVAAPQNGRNVFRVEARLGETEAKLRPGMEGVAKIVVGAGSYVWVWTRSLVERAQLLLWEWTP